MIKNVFSEFEGNNWAKIACGNVSSQTLSARRRKANMRDVPLSKCCVSGQWLCSAAISSKSIGSAAASGLEKLRPRKRPNLRNAA
jgi:hypothetical protein